MFRISVLNSLLHSMRRSAIVQVGTGFQCIGSGRCGLAHPSLDKAGLVLANDLLH